MYKESAWRLAINAFPTAQHMQTATGCAACSAAMPGVEHHFWTCLVAVAVREEIEGWPGLPKMWICAENQ
jgi:hypothetical protein